MSTIQNNEQLCFNFESAEFSQDSAKPSVKKSPELYVEANGQFCFIDANGFIVGAGGAQYDRTADGGRRGKSGS